MQQIEQRSSATVLNFNCINSKRTESVDESAAVLHSEGESVVAVAHDVRNMVTALGLYCDLLEEPGVLAAPFAHYGSELRLVAAASRRLVEKLMAIEHPDGGSPSLWRDDDPARKHWPPRQPGDSLLHQSTAWDPLPSSPVANLAAELMATRNLLAALAGPAIAVLLEINGGELPVRITSEDFTRVLVNLVKNAIEAMPCGGRIQIALSEQSVEDVRSLVLTVEDTGAGIPAHALEKVFASGFTAHAADARSREAAHRGLGLAITRSMIEAAGGHIRAENRAPCGARIVIELPVVQGAREREGGD